jgi:hypothetical protein
MKIDTVVDIFRGVLLNTPYISFINEVKIDKNSVKQGDLFISSNKKDIELAIKNGAYAIVFDNEKIKMNDDEIAWIKVKDINSAIFNYIRMYILHQKKSLFYVTPFQKDLIEQLNIKIISIINEKTFFEDIINDKDILVSSDIPFLNNITKKFNNINERLIENIDVLHYSIFETNVKYGDRVYNKVKVPKPFIREAFTLIEFLNDCEINISINDLKFSKYFNPIFVDYNLSKKEFGKTQSALVLNDDNFYLSEQTTFLSNFSWAKIVFITDDEEFISHKVKLFKNSEEIIKYLKSEKFNFAIYYGNNSNKIIKLLDQKPISNTLF